MENANSIFAVVVILAFVMGLAATYRLSKLERDVIQLRAQLRTLYRQIGQAFAPEVDRQLSGLISSGKTIAAIKLYREQTGAGLKESKEAVEAMQRGERPLGF